MKFNQKFAALVAGIAITLFGALSMAGTASAETSTASLKMDSLGGPLYKDAFKPVNWQVKTTIDGPGPKILPMKVADIRNPQGQLTFKPNPKMPVCPDSSVGPGKVSVDVPTIVARCPKAIIGNGLAKFALAQFKGASRDGAMVLFNGGIVRAGSNKGLTRVKVYAYSYDTNVGLYTEAVLQRNGQLKFDIPSLTADSSVTELDIAIPGKPISLFVESKGITVAIPAGQDRNYAKAKCTRGAWPFKAIFDLGTRDTAGQPTSPTVQLSNTSTVPCVGVAGKARFANLRIKGPGSVKAGRVGVYRVTVRNNGTATAKRARLVVVGKGVKGRSNVGNVAAGASKTVRVRVKFAKKGRVRAAFKVNAVRTAAKATAKVVRVR